MILKTVVVGMLHTNCYLLCDETCGKCAVIDPGANTEKIMKAIEETGMEVESIVLTHGHYDHVMAAPSIQKITGARLLVHKNDEPWLRPEVAGRRGYIREEYVQPRVDGYLEDGGSFTVGSLTCTVLHTPGHTPGSCCIRCGDIMLSGDTLFMESCGRCDLEGGDDAAMLRSLKRLAQLEGDCKVYPGHDVSTSLAYERENNRYMRFAVEQ